MQTEDEPRLGPTITPLDRMGIAELHAHIAGLRTEIARAEAEIGRKEALRGAADSVFRKG